MKGLTKDIILLLMAKRIRGISERLLFILLCTTPGRCTFSFVVIRAPDQNDCQKILSSEISKNKQKHLSNINGVIIKFSIFRNNVFTHPPTHTTLSALGVVTLFKIIIFSNFCLSVQTFREQREICAFHFMVWICNKLGLLHCWLSHYWWPLRRQVSRKTLS